MKFIVLTDEEVRTLNIVMTTHIKVLKKQTADGKENWEAMIAKLEELNEKINKKVVI
jgi:hypothetical protein